MENCIFNFTRPSPPCEKEKISGRIVNFNRGCISDDKICTSDDGILLMFTYNTMEIQVHTEVLQYNILDFIGAVGGFYSPYVGFSVTGLIGQVIDFFMKD